MTKKTCPNCQKEFDHIIEWRTMSVGWKQDFDGNLIDDTPIFADSSDLEDIRCPHCEYVLTGMI